MTDYRKIYLLANLSYPFRYKIGITNNLDHRLEQINATMRGRTFALFTVEVHFAEFFESFMHGIYVIQRAKMNRNISGHTEWFWFILPITPFLMMCLIWIVQRSLTVIIIMSIVYAISK